MTLADVNFSLGGTWGAMLGIDLHFYSMLWIPALVGVVLIMRRPAHKLARSWNLALTPELNKRLNRFLRLRSSLRIFLLVLLSQLLLLTALLPDSRRSQALFIVLLPGGIWISALAVSLLPRWKSRGTIRMAHLRRLRLKDTVTRLEIGASAGAYALGAVLAGWALWYAGTPWREWFWLPAILLAGQATLTITICKRVMNAPAAAAGALELAWDDVLRFERVRSLLSTGSFGTLYFITANAAGMAKVQAGSDHSQMVLTVALGLLVCGFIRLRDKSPARDNWRRAWPSGE